MKLLPIYEDDDIVAYNKPSGLLSIPDRFNKELPCLYHQAAKNFENLLVIHRLDKDTSGLICFAKNNESQQYMSKLFLERKIDKYYYALVHGKPSTPSGSIKERMMINPVKKGAMMIHKKGKEAHTDFIIDKELKNYTLLKLQLHTGRTHQIRVHLKHIGHQVVCDPIYGNNQPIYLSTIKKSFKLSNEMLEVRPLLKRLALHAYQISFINKDGKKINIEAPLTKDLDVTIKQLEKWG